MRRMNCPGFLVSHLIGNRTSFLCTKAPMVRVPETNFLHHINYGRDVSGDQTHCAASQNTHGADSFSTAGECTVPEMWPNGSKLGLGRVAHRVDYGDPRGGCCDELSRD